MSWSTFQVAMLAMIGVAALCIWAVQASHAIGEWLFRRWQRRHGRR